MTNSSELNAAIARAGISKKALAEAMGLTYFGLWKKIRNKSEFKATEILTIQKLLNLTSSQRDRIFFDTEGD